MVSKCYEQELLFGNNAMASIKRKALARLMVDAGIDKEKMSQVIGVSVRQVYNYVQDASSHREDVYKESRYRPKSMLGEYEQEIKNELASRPPATAKEAAVRIQGLTGLKRSPTQVRTFMRKHGFKPLKTVQIPAKANPEEQKCFLSDELEPCIEKAQKNEQVLLFMDAAHFVWQVYLGVLWCLARIFVPAASGRQRINVLGALNPITKELIKIVNRTYITSTTVCELLSVIKKKYKDRIITIVLDNARYQKCKLVTQTAASLNIELLFLPSYSPNLNLIERLWRFVKKECLYSKYYETSNDFEAAIMNCLEHVDTDKKERLDTLITFNFQLFDPPSSMQILYPSILLLLPLGLNRE